MEKYIGLEVYFNLILQELRSIKYFPKKNKKDRTNIRCLKKGCDNTILKGGYPAVFSMTLGKARAYHKKQMVNCQYNKRFPQLLSLLRDAVKIYDPMFNYTTIQINKNVLCPPHKDKNNVGLSLALAVGDFKGGGIEQYNDDGTSLLLDTKNKFQFQDGCKLHRTLPFEGERYSMVFFFHKSGFDSPMSPPMAEVLQNGMEELKLDYVSNVMVV